jgi:hypothetical protein
MILKYITYGLVFLITMIIGWFLVPFIYPIKEFVRRNEIRPFWWFLNNTLPEVEGDIDFGDFGRFKHNFIGFYRQNALRNPTHNLKLWLSPPKGDKENVIGELKMLSTQWDYKVGKRSATYTIKGVKCFRKSMIKEFGKFYLYYNIGFDDKWYNYTIKIGTKN